MYPTLRALSLLLAATLLPTPAASQVIEFTKIVDENSEIRGYGDRPALHAEEVAFLGRDQTTGLAGIYRTPADGTGPFTLIVDELTRTLAQQVPGAAPAGTYTYTVNAGTLGAAILASDSFAFTKQESGALLTVSSTTDWSVRGWDEALSAGASSTQPEKLAITEAAPNPFTALTRIALDVPEAQHVTVAVYDALGREVAVLHDGEAEVGTHALSFDGRRLPSGLYVVRAVGNTAADAQRLILAR